MFQRISAPSRFLGCAGVAFVAAGLVIPVRAQDPDDLRRGVARVSLINGEVSIQRGDSGDWVPASLNAPIVTSDHLATGPNSRAEVQFDSATALRVGGEAEISFSQLEAAHYQMALAHGTVTFRVLRTSSTDMEVDTPSISVRPSRQGSYRIAVNDSGQTEVTARSGEVEVFSPSGSQWVRAGQTLMARGSAADPEFQVVRASSADEWDRWNDSRDQVVLRSVSPQYVGPGVYGVEDLDPYGTWVDVPGYGWSWRPVVVAGWAPYRQGRWVWEDWYGWTWISYEPWGWAPYHYGRWFFEPAFGWCWYPGAIGVRHYWSPALVAFFGFGGVGVAFGNVGWVPLAPYEALHPWWGRGFYGGTYLNRTINITNVNITNTYRNARAFNGVTAVSATDFRGGRFHNFVNVSSEQLRQAGSVRGGVPMAPERAHLNFSERQDTFVPPRAAANTRVYTRQQPRPAPSVSFAEQRRNLVQGSRELPPSAPNSNPGWQRFGNPRGNSLAGPAPQPATRPVNRGWNRFGGTANASPAEVRPAQPVAPQRSIGPNRAQQGPTSPPAARDRQSAPQRSAPSPSRGPSGDTRSGGGNGSRGGRNR